MTIYETTYALDGPRGVGPAEVLDRTLATVAAMREEDVPIDHRGSTVRYDGSGTPVALTARFEAPTQGTVGRLSCRSRLPACGIRRVEPSAARADEFANGTARSVETP